MDKVNTLTKQEFQLLAQLLDSGVRATGINIAAGGNDLISAMQKFFAMKPEEQEPKKTEE